MSNALTKPMDVGSQSMTQRSWLSGQREDSDTVLTCRRRARLARRSHASQVEFARKESTRKFHDCAHQTQHTESIPGSSTCRQVRCQARRDRRVRFKVMRSKVRIWKRMGL